MDNKAYQSPQADLSLEQASFEQKHSLFNLKGRMGRVRFLNYSFILPILLSLIPLTISMINVLAAINKYGTGDPKILAAGISSATVTAVWSYLILSIVFPLIAGMQRWHDLGKSGWLTLLQLLPLVTVILWFIPGEKQSNNFGAIPKENTALTFIPLTIFAMVILFIALMVLKYG